MLLGDGPRLAWVRGELDRLSAGAGNTSATIESVSSPPTRDGLIALTAEPIDTVVLVDHAPLEFPSLKNAGSTAKPASPGASSPKNSPPKNSPPKGSPPKLSPVEAVRGVAQQAILGFELSRRSARTLRLDGDNAERWPSSLAALMGLPPPSEAATAPPAAAPRRTFDPPGDLLMATYLSPLFAAAPHNGPLVITWPREAFFDGDAPGQHLPALVEVAGRPRILAYGPYLPLPEGRWRARAWLGFSADFGKMPFILEADCGGVVSRGFFEVERGGIFTLELDFQVIDAMHPVEMRLISQDSALEGQVALIEVALEELR